MEFVISILIVLVIIFLYLLPAIMAYARKHKDFLAIFLLCILTGWTGIGWIIALIWAGTGNVRVNGFK